MGLKDKLKHAIAPVAAAATVVLTPGIRSEEIPKPPVFIPSWRGLDIYENLFPEDAIKVSEKTPESVSGQNTVERVVSPQLNINTGWELTSKGYLESQKMHPKFIDIIEQWNKDVAGISSVFELSPEEKNTPEYRRFLSEKQEFDAGKRSKPPRDEMTERKIDQALAHTPFRIQAESTDEKKVLYTYLHVLMNSDMGKAWTAEAQKVADSKGKITLETAALRKGVGGQVQSDSPRTIQVSRDLFDAAAKYIKNVKEGASINYGMVGVIAHELQHVLTKHKDPGKRSSLEKEAQTGVMDELNAKITDVVFLAEHGGGDSLSDFYRDDKHTRMHLLKLNEQEADTEARTALATLLLTNAKNGENLDPEFKDRIKRWNNHYRDQAIRNAGSKQITDFPEVRAQEEKLMDYLCVAARVDKDKISAALNQFFPQNKKQPPKGMSEMLQNGQDWVQRRFQKGASVVITPGKVDVLSGKTVDEIPATYLLVDGKLSRVSFRYKKRMTLIRYADGRKVNGTEVFANGNIRQTTFDANEQRMEEKLLSSKTGMVTITKYDPQGARASETLEYPDGSKTETYFDTAEKPKTVIETKMNGSFKRTNFEDGYMVSILEKSKMGQVVAKDAQGNVIHASQATKTDPAEQKPKAGLLTLLRNSETR